MQALLSGVDGTARRKPAEVSIVEVPDAHLEVEPAQQKKIVGVMGVGFLLLMFGTALFIADPSPFQLLVFRLVLSLAAGGLGAWIPGLIEVRVRPWLRAGGAMAAFVVVYLVNPPELVLGR